MNTSLKHNKSTEAVVSSPESYRPKKYVKVKNQREINSNYNSSKCFKSKTKNKYS